MNHDLPPAWAGRLRGYAWRPQTIGCSDAGVFRLEADGRPTLFVKTEKVAPLAELPDEIARLRWLGARGVACPRVLADDHHAGSLWLLMTAVPGRDLASSPELSPERCVEIVAAALRGLHGLDTANCPFDHRLDLRLATARARMTAGLVDETDFDDERAAMTAAGLHRQLLADRPLTETLVVTHGDACLPNLMVDGGRFSGFIDCGRLGVADRCQDLALVCRSIRDDFGEEWIAPFLALYGKPDADPAKLSYYQLLDEFF